MATKLTPQQHVAVIRREVSVVLSSGAGCGKTHVLTERYLSHLRDDGAEVGQVVAITFTDRAARQMRSRIRQTVAHHLRAASTDVEAERWARHLRGLETAQISTIHAFCGTLLRQHAVEAGLDPRFDVLEDVLSVNLETEALTACLQRLLTAQSEAGEDLRQLVLLYGWRPVVGAVQHLMQAWDERGWSSWLARSDDELAGDWQQRARAVLLPRYVDYLMAANPKIARCLTLLRTTPCRPESKMAKNVRFLLDNLPRLAEEPDLSVAVEMLAEVAKVGGERGKAWYSEEAYQSVKTALEGFREELRGQKLEAFAETPEQLTSAVGVGKRFLRVAREAIQAYGDLKRRNSVVDFQDLLILARDLLRDQAEIRARLQGRYRFLLIDELQDTDPVQMELVELLCGGGLTAGKLFAVGDSKQSIYRFRGADVAQFQKLRHTMPHEGRLDLTLNFRSQPAILDFANALFARCLQDYEPLRPHHAQVNPGPCVEFLWSPRGDKESVTEARSQEAKWIARRIASMVNGQEALVVDHAKGTLRPVRPGDIVLLFRAMSNVPLYEAALRDHGLDYYLVGGRAFFAQQEIYDLLNLLRALENPQDAVSLAGTLRSPFCCLSDEALFVLGRHPDGLWAGLHDPNLCPQLPEDQLQNVDRAQRHLDRWRGFKDRLPIARLLGEVFADSGFDAATQFEFLGDRKLANLWKLVDLARTFDRSGLFGLAEFIQRLGDLVRTQPREEQAATQPENADVVRLMSIHQAKGLEFPVVFVPDVVAAFGGPHRPAAYWDARLGCVARKPADEETPPFPEFGWRLWQATEAIEEWHEELRTLYVACTRAQDYLVLSAALKESFSPDNTWMLTLSEHFDLRGGQCLISGIDEERMPKVRVIQGQQHPLTPDPSPPRGEERKSAPLSPWGRGAGGEGLSSPVAPIPLRLRGKRLITAAEIDHYLRNKTDPDAQRLKSTDFARQFDAEDGSDRSEWLHPSLALRASNRFAVSDISSQFANARTRHCDVEYLLDWQGDVTVRDVIDRLWQDAEGGWHLLLFTNEKETRGVSLLLAALAVQRRFQSWPKSATLAQGEGETVLMYSGEQLQEDQLPAVVGDVLRAIAALSLSD